MIVLSMFLIAYIAAINFYAFILMKGLHEESVEGEIDKSSDGRLFLTAFLGGAITIYVCMFLYKYRLKSLFLMLVMPILGVLNIYLWILAFRSGIPLFIR